MRSARNHIDPRQAKNLWRAIDWASALGRPLNVFVTINFAHTSCAPEDAPRAFERLRDHHYTPWLRYQAVSKGSVYAPPTHVWTIEQSSNMTHVHWLVHVERKSRGDFVSKLDDWLYRVTGDANASANTIDAKHIYDNIGLRRYILKGISPKDAHRFGIRPSPQGIVYGKRCGISRCLGPAARAKRPSTAAA